MSKASKSRSKDHRKKMKAGRKAAQRAKYEGFMKSGQNSKSKRFVAKGKRAKAKSTVSHPNGPCGNPGCVLCFGEPTYAGFRVNGKLIPGKHPHRAWLAEQRIKAAASAVTA